MTCVVPPPVTRDRLFAHDLARHGDRTAVVTERDALTYSELAARVDRAARDLGGGRRLVLVAATNTLDTLVTYLAALAAGHVVLVAAGDNRASVDALIDGYDPDVVVRPLGDGAGDRAGDRAGVEHRREGSAHDLHPDLGLLLSTSGSTGSPKLVRLSYTNLQANAESIATYLDIRPTDRAATTLPVHYCYGLSVVHSHLLRGAGLILTSLSVVDACFWALFRRARGTSFAGVPYTFDLLDRIDFASMSLPDLRYVTQAGGRLAPERVVRYAELGQRRGWDLFVMYGQTEATARMAYLPPGLAATRPGAIGVPVPGGSFRLEPLTDLDEAGTEAGTGAGAEAGDLGELVYSGPNVMMGYARSPADLALGASLDELRSGDIARRASDGLYEIVGRRSRFAKVFGIRIDLQHLEDMLSRRGVSACCVSADDAVAVVVEVGDSFVGAAASAEVEPDVVRALVAGTCQLPERAVHVHRTDALPRLPTGKPDLLAVRELALPAGSAGPPVVRSRRSRQPRRPDGEYSAPRPSRPGTRTESAAADVRSLYAEVLRRDRDLVTDDRTFVSLGGDSLSYVELSLRLEDALGHLPPGWHTTPVGELRRRARPAAARSGGSVEVSVLLRAISIVLVVGTHANTFDSLGGLVGGAHLLVAVAGYNFARFHLTDAPRVERTRRMLRSVAHVAVPSILFVVALVLTMDEHSWPNILLLNNVFGPAEPGPPWEFWFVEALVQILLVVAALLSVPAVDRWQRRWPFTFAAGLLTVGLLTRFDVVDLPAGPRDSQTSLAVFWLFALGWTAAAAATRWQRLAVTATAVLVVPGAFAEPSRTVIVVVGLMLLIWATSVRLPRVLRPLRPVLGALAGGSLYIYLTHWQVFPYLQDDHPVPALLASLAVGVAAWKGWSFATAQLARRWAEVRQRPPRHQPLARPVADLYRSSHSSVLR